jgi:hypothetical protein
MFLRNVSWFLAGYKALQYIQLFKSRINSHVKRVGNRGFLYNTIHANTCITSWRHWYLFLKNPWTEKRGNVLLTPLLLLTGLRYQRNYDIRETSKVTNAVEETQGYQHNWTKYVESLEEVGNPLLTKRTSWIKGSKATTERPKSCRGSQNRPHTHSTNLQVTARRLEKTV